MKPRCIALWLSTALFLMAASLQRTALLESEWNLIFPAGPQGRGRR